MTTAEIAAVAREWEQACRTRDVERIMALLDPDATIWYNFSGATMDTAGYREALEQSYAQFSTTHYRDLRVSLHEHGFIEQSTLECSNDVEMIVAPFCLFVTVANGKVTKLEEYFDAGTLTPVPLPAGADR